MVNSSEFAGIETPDIWGLLGHEYICPTIVLEWLSPTAGLVRFLYQTPADLPFRGVVNIHISGSEYEFKGMVFRSADDAPTPSEHRAIKGYLSSQGLTGKSRRLKNGNIVTKTYHREIAA